MPTGGTTYTGTNVNGTADGLNYGIWTNGSGGSITVFPNAHAFSASWNNSLDFLAHLGLDFNTPKAYTAYGTVTAEIVESKTGTSGSFSSIGMYGWMHSPCVEWYINEDSFTGLAPRGNVTAVIDGATYYLSTSMTTGDALLISSIDGSSWKAALTSGDAPTMSPAPTVSDRAPAASASPRSFFSQVVRYSTPPAGVPLTTPPLPVGGSIAPEPSS